MALGVKKITKEVIESGGKKEARYTSNEAEYNKNKDKYTLKHFGNTILEVDTASKEVEYTHITDDDKGRAVKEAMTKLKEKEKVKGEYEVRNKTLWVETEEVLVPQEISDQFREELKKGTEEQKEFIKNNLSKSKKPQEHAEIVAERGAGKGKLYLSQHIKASESISNAYDEYLDAYHNSEPPVELENAYLVFSESNYNQETYYLEKGDMLTINRLYTEVERYRTKRKQDQKKVKLGRIIKEGRRATDKNDIEEVKWTELRDKKQERIRNQLKKHIERKKEKGEDYDEDLLDKLMVNMI